MFVPTAGGHTLWSRVITNPRGDAFILGSTDSGPVLAKFGWNGEQVYRVSLRAFGLIGVSDLGRDKGGNLYLSGWSSTSAKIVKLNAAATKVVYTKDLEVSGRIYVDGYSQAYVVGKAPAGMTPVNAPQPLPGGGDDGFVTVVSVDGKRVIYQTYVGGEKDESVTGGGIYSDGSVSIGGNSRSLVWLGMDWCLSVGYDAACYTPVYYAKIGPYKRGSLPAKASFGTIAVGSTKTINIVYKNVGNAPIRALRVFPGLFKSLL